VLIHRHADGLFLAKHYRFVRRLGMGSFGRVDMVQERATGSERVCKVVNTLGMKPSTLDMMKREIRILSELDHPHIVKIHEWAEDTDRHQLILILEYIPGGTLGGFLKREGGALGEAVVARLIRQLLVAVAYCHEHGVIHRDIKPDNMMISQTALTRSPDCKVIDFGLASSHGGGEAEDRDEAGGARPASQSWVRRVGTPAYMAPEVVDRHTAYTCKADIWSIGVTCLELLTGARLFQAEGVRATFAKIRAYRGPEALLAAAGRAGSWQRLSSQARDFLRRLLQADPAQRPSAAEALMQPWVVQVKDASAGVKGQVLQSLSSYLRASSAVRDCLMLVASCAGAKDVRGLDTIFLGLDGDGDGQLSWQELAAAFHVDAQRGGEDADAFSTLQAGEIRYTEFVAACLHGRFSSLKDLAARAFSVLDDDRDGKLSVAGIREAFPECRCSLLDGLPQDRAFGVEEWCERVRLANGCESPGRAAKLRLCVAGSRLLSRAGGS